MARMNAATIRVIVTAALISLSLPALAQTPSGRAKAPISTSDSAIWPRLTAEEKAKLRTELSRSKGQIVVACALSSCRALAHDIAAVFKAGGWEVTLILHGGFGIDGVGGIRANSCGIAAGRVKEAIERVTTRKIDVVDDGACDDPQLYLTIGARE